MRQILHILQNCGYISRRRNGYWQAPCRQSTEYPELSHPETPLVEGRDLWSDRPVYMSECFGYPIAETGKYR